MKRILIFGLLFIAVSLWALQFTGCVPGVVSKGVGEEAYWKKDYSTALKEFQKAAGEGDVLAQYYLSGMYGRGEGVAKNEAESERWLKMSAEQGYAPAQCDVGLRYYLGRRVKKDYGKALEWFQKAAQQEDMLALYFLGWMYAEGVGTNKDNAKALTYFRTAKGKGFPVDDTLLTEKGISEIKPLPGS